MANSVIFRFFVVFFCISHNNQSYKLFLKHMGIWNVGNVPYNKPSIVYVTIACQGKVIFLWTWFLWFCSLAFECEVFILSLFACISMCNGHRIYILKSHLGSSHLLLCKRDVWVLVMSSIKEKGRWSLPYHSVVNSSFKQGWSGVKWRSKFAVGGLTDFNLTGKFGWLWFCFTFFFWKKGKC